MIKKLLWMSIAVLVAACTFYITNGQGLDQTPTPNGLTPTFCADCGDVVVATAPITPPGDWVTVVATQNTSTPTKVVTATPTAVPPTATMTKVSATATKTPIPTNTATSVPTSTPTATIAASITPTVTPTPSYAVQTGSPVYMANFAHPDLGCNWEGVAGQVFNASGKPVTNYVVKVSGTYNGTVVNLIGLTGMAAGVPYGPKGYEIVFGNTPVHTDGQLTIQVFNTAGASVTTPVQFTTYATCTRNLIIINFVRK